MKTLLSSILVIALLGVSLSAAQDAPAQDKAVAISVRSVDNAGWEVTRGMPAKTALRRLGEPDARIAPGVWVYQGYRAVQKGANANQVCDRLVITIADDKVADIHFANHAAVTVLASGKGRLPPSTGTMVAGAK